MAIALDTATSLNSGAWSSGSSFTWSHTCSGDKRYLVVGIFADSNTDLVTGVTYAGVSMTRLNTYNNNAGTSRIYMYGLIAPSTGINNIIVTLSTSNPYVACGATSYTGVSQISQPDSTATNRSTTGVSSLTLTTTIVANDSWLVGLYRNGSVTPTTTETGCVKRAGYYGGGVSLVDSNLQLTNGVKSITETLVSGTASDWIGIIISLSPYQSMTLGEYLPNSSTKLLLHLNGSSADSSGNSNNGTDTNITYSQANGKFGQGAGFNVSTSKIISSTAPVTVSSNKSFGGWFKINSQITSGVWKFIDVTTGTGGNTGSEEGIQYQYNSGTPRLGFFRYNGTTYNPVEINYTLSVGVWYHLFFTWDGSNIKAYLNGNNIGTVASTFTTGNTSYLNGYGIGSYQSGSGGFANICADEVIIENRAWSASEVKKYYTMAKGRFGII